MQVEGYIDCLNLALLGQLSIVIIGGVLISGVVLDFLYITVGTMNSIYSKSARHQVCVQ